MLEIFGRYVFWTTVSWALEKSSALAAEKMLEYLELRQKYAKLQQENTALKQEKSALKRSTDHVLHELRNSAISISSTADALKESDIKEKDERLQAISSAAAKQLKILNTSLDWSKLEEGKIRLNMGLFNINEVIQSLHREVKESLKNKGLSLALKLPSLEGVWVESDELRLSELLGNLISNAIKFTLPGKGPIEVCLTYPQDAKIGEEISLTITVKDRGIGMSPHIQKQLFTRFSQVNPSKEGSGIGLYNCRLIAKAMGGDMRLVESHEGEGSIFEFTIPCKKSQPKREEIIQPFEVTPVSSHKYILVVEDNKFLRQTTVQQLIKRGYKCEAAEDGQEAIDRCKSQTFDVILMDINMPNMDGITAAQKIRTQSGILNPHVRIIGFSASSLSNEAQREAMQRWMNGYLIKSIVNEELIRYIESKESIFPAFLEFWPQKSPAVKEAQHSSSTLFLQLPASPSTQDKCKNSEDSSPSLPEIGVH